MELFQEVQKLRQNLKASDDFENNPIDLSLPVIPPFIGSGEIKLIILGQDPTVKNVNSRKKITCTLNLDKKNSLKVYIIRICVTLGIAIENVYATNLFKYFYTERPSLTIEILEKHLDPNINLLRKELAIYENIPIITLGEPVLRLLTNSKNKVNRYWDYDSKAKKTNGKFTYSLATQSKLNRDFYPLPHQPSIRYALYNDNLEKYLQIVRT